MTSIIKAMLPMGAALAAVAVAGAALAQERPMADQALLATGKAIYDRECAACHGPEGDGKGLGAHYLNPRPRDFTLGVYKLRSTPNGQPPTDADMFRSITNGIPNSMMPSFKSLPDRERWALVEVIKRFGGIEEEEPKTVPVPAEPKVTMAALENGANLYVKLKCGTCHGDEGFGDGPSSLTLKNDAKERIFPTDLSTGVFKGGGSGADLYLRLATGMDGSPMPSYSAEATPGEIWDLVHYVKSLAQMK